MLATSAAAPVILGGSLPFRRAASRSSARWPEASSRRREAIQPCAVRRDLERSTLGGCSKVRVRPEVAHADRLRQTEIFPVDPDVGWSVVRYVEHGQIVAGR